MKPIQVKGMVSKKARRRAARQASSQANKETISGPKVQEGPLKTTSPGPSSNLDNWYKESHTSADNELKRLANIDKYDEWAGSTPFSMERKNIPNLPNPAMSEAALAAGYTKKLFGSTGGNLKGAWSGVLDWMDDGFKGGGKGIMPSIIGAGIGGTYGFVGNFFAPDNVQVQNPMRSALMGAAAGFGLGALGGAAGGVKAVNKANQGFMYHVANKTQKVAKGTTASVAIGIAAYAGSKDTSYTKPLNRNSHI